MSETNCGVCGAPLNTSAGLHSCAGAAPTGNVPIVTAQVTGQVVPMPRSTTCPGCGYYSTHAADCPVGTALSAAQAAEGLVEDVERGESARVRGEAKSAREAINRAVEGMSDEAAVGIARTIAAADPRPSGLAECAALMRQAIKAALGGTA